MIRRRICRASAVAPGTCGELAQGMINGTHFLITCPIDMYSAATVEISHGDGAIRGPEDSPKASRAVQATLEFLGETVSAIANQQVLFNPHLESTLELAAQTGAVGVNVAHSGTVIGMLFADDAPVVERAAALAREQLPDLQWLRHSRMVRGGVKLS